MFSLRSVTAIQCCQTLEDSEASAWLGVVKSYGTAAVFSFWSTIVWNSTQHRFRPVRGTFNRTAKIIPPYMLHCPREEYENVHRCIMEYGIQMRLVNIPIACTRITLPRASFFFKNVFFSSTPRCTQDIWRGEGCRSKTAQISLGETNFEKRKKQIQRVECVMLYR